MKEVKPFRAGFPASGNRTQPSTPLDLSTVPTVDFTLCSGNDLAAKKAASARMFNLPEAPVYTPTRKEFDDPLAYIAKIRPEAERFGICKIIPPEGWKPKFALDTESFQFDTRVQKLNSMEGATRTNLNYLDALYKWHRQAGHPITRIPMLDHKALDLFRLKKEVAARGGPEKVTNGKKWAEIGRILKVDSKTCTSMSASLKAAYMKVCWPYEQFLQKQRTLSPAGTPSRDSSADGRGQSTRISRMAAGVTPGRMGGPSAPTRMAGGAASTLKAESQQLPSFPTNDHWRAPAQPLSKVETTAASSAPSTISSGSATAIPLRRSPRSRKHTQNVPQTTASPPPAVHAHFVHSNDSRGMKRSASVDGAESQKKRPKSDLEEEVKENGTAQDGNGDPSAEMMQTCEICKKGGFPDQALLCDDCDKAYHIFCLDPPLDGIPEGEWYCTNCLVHSGGGYGFEEGGTYSLHEFKIKADDFKRKWFPNNPDVVGVDSHGGAKGGLIVERAVEKEFWRLVESPHVTCDVEYGADLHSTVHGSGFPTVEKQPLDPYSRHGWNLNVIPVLRDSLFSHIKSDISGMMVPWLYVGMCFSTFCWHNEDHYTYSVNYMHWGDTKTWYGIPSSDAELFEQAMREAVPELFEDNPDLLFQLVTMLSPGRLMKNGVKVFALDQRPGQFVVTFPQSYHAGFNHGFNFNEAVNFAPSDWEPFGLACAQRYSQYRRMPVFSHDELLVTALRNDSRLRSAAWLRKALIIRHDQELAQRARIRSTRGAIVEVKEETQRHGDMARCAHCRTYCYFSAIGCDCYESRVVCLEHEEELCQCDRSRHILRLHFTDLELNGLVRQEGPAYPHPTAGRTGEKGHSRPSKRRSISPTKVSAPAAANGSSVMEFCSAVELVTSN